MRKPDTVMRELGQLYDFNKEIARFRIRKTAKPASDQKAPANQAKNTVACNVQTVK